MNITRLQIGLFLVTSLLSATAVAQDQCRAIERAKANTYGFHPAELSKDERSQKSKQMDAFWTSVKSSGKVGISCVRQLIANETTDTYFIFDGASLLADLDRTGASDDAILSGLTRTDLKDVAPDGYIHLCLQLTSATSISDQLQTSISTPRM